MKISKQNLQRLIKEELQTVLYESNSDLDVGEDGVPSRMFRSPKPFTNFFEVDQDPEPGFKPAGLWYACGSSWDDWCQMVMPDEIARSPHVYQIEVNPSRILNIRNRDQLQGFNAKYGVSINSSGSHLIDWRALEKDFDGIEICPYQPESRYEPLWYHGWDVASGCIWGSGAFKSVKKIKDMCRVV